MKDSFFTLLSCICSDGPLFASEPLDSNLEEVFGNKTQYEANPQPNSTVKSTFGEPNVKIQEPVLLPISTVNHPNRLVLDGSPFPSEPYSSNSEEGFGDFETQDYTILLSNLTMNPTLCDDEDTIFCSPLPPIELDLEGEDVDHLLDFELTSNRVPLEQPTLPTSTDDRDEVDFSEREDNIPVVLSTLSPGLVRLSDLYSVFIFFLLICFSIIIILWLLLAYVYIINLVLMKIRSSSSLPSETCNNCNPSSNV